MKTFVLVAGSLGYGLFGLAALLEFVAAAKFLGV